MPAGYKRTKEEVKEIVEKCGYIYIDDYHINKKIRRVVIQDKNGYKYDVVLSCVLNNRGINFSDKRNPFILENIKLWLKTNNSQFELLEDNEYKGSESKLNLYCHKCKDYLRMNWHNISQGVGCGICDGDQVGFYHSLDAERPDIAKEWHPTLNGKLTPKDVTRGCNKEVWWLCPNGHNYFSSINSRTNMGSGCKKCSDEYKESRIASELKKYILNKYNAKEEYSIFISPETKRVLPYDIYIFGGEDPKINGVYIEVHWYQHYKIGRFHKLQANKKGTTPEEEFEYQKYKDRLKRRFACKNGTYIEIDLRKIKTTEEAIEYIESFIEK